METWSVHQLSKAAKNSLSEQSAKRLSEYARTLKRAGLPVIFTLRHLAKITDVDYSFLRKTVERRRESSNYRMFAIKKRSGGRRHIHSVARDLQLVQQFINSEILQHTDPHPSSFAFSSSGGIRACASMHCGAKWLFKFDLANFFYSINEADVYKTFIGLGYRPLLAFELARLCTTLRLPKHLRGLLRMPSNSPIERSYNFYQRCHAVDNFDIPYNVHLGVLPQGAPTSPMLSNLVAYNLDVGLTEFADQHGLVYTRYADDLTFSSSEDVIKEISVGHIHRSVVKEIRKNKFFENPKKTRVAGPGSRKLVLGLLVDQNVPRLSKETYKRIDRHLYAISKYGLTDVSNYENFDSPIGFYNHLSGLISFVKDVDPKRWHEFKERFDDVIYPVNLIL